jgi:uncharacterized protein
MSGVVVAFSVCTALAALAVLILVVVAHLFTTPRRIPPRPLPTEAANEFTSVRFPARDGSVQLTAWYRRTAHATSAVIFVHGRDSCRGDELRGNTFRLAQRIASQGMSVVMLDLRGHGDSDAARLTFGRRERHDVLGTVDFLLARGYPAGRIGVLGASMGGASVIAAAADDTAIGAVVTDSAFADLGDVLRLQFTRLTKLPACCLSGALVVARFLTGEDLTLHSPLQSMRRLRGRPALVIHAVRDPFVPVAHARALAAAGNARTWITTGDRHLGSYHAVGEEYDAVVSAFFLRHLRPRDAALSLTRRASSRRQVAARVANTLTFASGKHGKTAEDRAITARRMR